MGFWDLGRSVCSSGFRKSGLGTRIEGQPLKRILKTPGFRGEHRDSVSLGILRSKSCRPATVQATGQLGHKTP